MQIHNLKRKTENKKSVQVGRGGTRGKTSGRGTKGQNARSGHKKRPELRDLIKKLPKLRGRGKNIFKSFQADYTPVNLELIEKHFAAGDTVSPVTLVEKGLAKQNKGNNPIIKILGGAGTKPEVAFGKKLLFVDCKMSASAKVLIEKAGGTVK